MREIDDIILHCSATPAGRDFTVADLRRWHVGRGFSDVGYHWIVYRDGTIHPGRPENIPGAHCKGHNARSIGVCYIGGTSATGQPADTRTPEQRAALRNLVRNLRQRYPAAALHGHRDYAAKACPSFKVEEEEW